ncbi:MAG: hypothetical protein ACOCXG_00345 [Nanoarchaeota archaeon]
MKFSQTSQQKIDKIIADGAKNLYILADFDGTLTLGIDKNGVQQNNSISVFRNENFLDEDYVKRSHELKDKYFPLENDHTLPFEKRFKFCQEWWTKHFELLREKGLSMKEIEEVLQRNLLHMRTGLKQFLTNTYTAKMPVFVYSASGAGDLVKLSLKRNGVQGNIEYMINEWITDSKGRFLKTKSIIIHSMNKNGLAIKQHGSYPKIQGRKNIIILGDGAGDVNMSSDLDYDICLKIGFLNILETDPKYEEKRKFYEKIYDIVLPWDSGLEPITEIIKKTYGN